MSFLTSGSVSKIFSAIARCALYDVPVGIRNLSSAILKPRRNFSTKGKRYEEWIDLEFRMKRMLMGTART
jgi:hypothetical protein